MRSVDAVGHSINKSIGGEIIGEIVGFCILLHHHPHQLKPDLIIHITLRVHVLRIVRRVHLKERCAGT